MARGNRSSPAGFSGLLFRLILAAAVLSAFLVAAACGGDESRSPVVLDGSPRVPDDEGVATDLDVEGKSLTLDGDRSYQLSDQLRSFSALDLSIQPLADAADAYVQVGLEGRTVVWLGRIAKVVPTDPPRVYYVGRFSSVGSSDEGRRIVFGEGTVLNLADGVEPPEGSEGEILQAEIDPAAHEVVALRLG